MSCTECAKEGKTCPGFRISVTASTFGSCACGDGHLKKHHTNGGGTAKPKLREGVVMGKAFDPGTPRGKINQCCEESGCTEFKAYPFGNPLKCSNCFHLHSYMSDVADTGGGQIATLEKQTSSLTTVQKDFTKMRQNYYVM